MAELDKILRIQRHFTGMHAMQYELWSYIVPCVQGQVVQSLIKLILG